MTESKQIPTEKRRKPRAVWNIARFRHAVLGLAAAAIMASGGALMAGAVISYAGWLKAVAEPPQDYLALGGGALQRPGLAGEIAMRAQIDPPRAYFVALGSASGGGDGGEAFAAPLFPPELAAEAAEVTAVLLEPAGAPAESAFANWVRSVGPRGVVIEVLGRLLEPDPLTRERIALALRREGLRLAEDAAFLDPHHRPRRVELAPHRYGLAFAGSVIGVGALLALLTLASAERSRRKAARREAAQKPPQSATPPTPIAPEPDPQPEPAKT